MIISVWSGPRNVSTALMYSFAQRKDVKVVDEPLYGYYLKKTGVQHPGSPSFLPGLEQNPEVIIQSIKQLENQYPHVFLKNMAHHLIGLDTRFVEDYLNVFLIRDPEEMLPSLVKQIPNPELLDTAYKMQWDLYKHLTETASYDPMIIDSKRLLMDPEEVLKSFCVNAGLDWDENMLKWEKGAIPEDGLWAEYWYDTVHDSTGFAPYQAKNEDVPVHLRDLSKECRYYYESLIEKAL